MSSQEQMGFALREKIKRAITEHRRGNTAEAARLYNLILREKPNQFEASLYLGVLESQRGRHEAAYRLISQAISADPHSAEAYASLGDTVLALNRPDDALANYDRALAIRPDYAGALNSRGAALTRLNRLSEAVASYDRALTMRPDYADALNNRGVALEALDQLNEALTSFEMALRLKPGYVHALNNRGNVLQRLGRYEDALASYDAAIEIHPDYADALNNRGNTLLALARPEAAIASFDKALTIQPDLAAALVHRSKALYTLDQHEQALASCDRALTFSPGFADAWNCRGLALAALERHTEALESYDRALAINPSSFKALNNRGVTLQALNRNEEALDSYQQALAINPQFADGLYNLGNALQDLDRPVDAIASYDRALAIKGNHTDVLYARGNALQRLSRHEEAMASYEKALALKPASPYAKWMLILERMHCCRWTDYEGDTRWLVNEARDGKHVASPFTLLLATDSGQDHLRAAQTYVRQQSPSAPAAMWTGERYAHDRIRLAYLSADFTEHPTAFLTAGLFERHDAKRFETIAVSFGPSNPSDMRSRLERAFERFIDVRMQSDQEVALTLRRLEVDIAVDLMGFTWGCRPRILAFRPAPIHVNYLGYPGTMGADYMDYILADRCVIPSDHQGFYSERVVYLPHTYQVNDEARRIGERLPTRADASLPETGFVFCSFNNNNKITPAMFDIWMRLLRKVDGAVLWLLEGNTAAPENLRREAAARGVAPERLVFAPRAKLADHLARHRLADLFLDTLPYNAHTTASDALWAGLPVLTCLGKTFAGRVAASLLEAVGLRELITPSLGDYEALALKLAKHHDMLAQIRQKLVKNRDTFPLFDTDRFRRHIEAAYISMWERHQRSEPLISFAVAPIDR